MIKKSLLVLISTLSLVSVFPKEIKAQTFEKVSIEKKFNDCKKDPSETNPCLDISIEYPKVLGKFKNSKVVDEFIKDRILELLSNYAEKSLSKKTTIEEAIKKASIDFKKENEGSTVIPWNYTSSTQIVFESSKYVSVVVNNYSFTGGAHGNSSSYYMTFNLNTGKPITLDNIAKDKKKLLQIAEKKFRSTQSIPPKQDFESAGFWFKDNKFFLPNNFAITKEGVLFQYGLYEIAPYSAGMIDLVIKNNEYKFSY